MKIPYIHHSHSICLLVCHLVITTVRRKPTLTEECSLDFFRKAVDKYPINIISGEIGEDFSHVHLMIQIPNTMSLAQVAQVVKGTSSRQLKLMNDNWKGWSKGYFACSVGQASVEVVKQYIENQRNKD